MTTNENKTPQIIMVVLGLLLVGLAVFTYLTYQDKKDLEAEIANAGQEIGVNQETDLTFTIEGAMNPQQAFGHLLQELQPSMRQSFVINNITLRDHYR